jgi:hypothetical protein
MRARRPETGWVYSCKPARKQGWMITNSTGTLPQSPHQRHSCTGRLAGSCRVAGSPGGWRPSRDRGRRLQQLQTAASDGPPLRPPGTAATKESGGVRAWPLIMTWCPDKRAVNSSRRSRAQAHPGGTGGPGLCRAFDRARLAGGRLGNRLGLPAAQVADLGDEQDRHPGQVSPRQGLLPASRRSGRGSSCAGALPRCR